MLAGLVPVGRLAFAVRAHLGFGRAGFALNPLMTTPFAGVARHHHSSCAHGVEAYHDTGVWARVLTPIYPWVYALF